MSSLEGGGEARVEREQRLASNESVFREVNERIAEIAERLDVDESERWEYFCECAAVGCTARISLTRAEYEHVRERPNRFAVAAGHVMPSIEHVVERCGDYEIVEKDGEAGRASVALDHASEFRFAA